MNQSLVEILIGMKTNPALVVELYEKLFVENYFAIVRKETQSVLSHTEFLSYECADGIFELPLFTDEKFIFEGLGDSTIINANGNLLWERLLEIIENKNLQIAVDPGQPHGIRLRKEMILGMINNYGNTRNAI